MNTLPQLVLVPPIMKTTKEQDHMTFNLYKSNISCQHFLFTQVLEGKTIHASTKQFINQPLFPFV